MSKVRAAKPKVAGGVFLAPKGTTLPTDATTALADTFVNLGYVSEDGITNNWSKQSNNKKAWGGETVLIMKDGLSDIFKFTMIESVNEDVLKLIYGENNVSGTLSTGLAIEALGEDDTEYVFVLDMKLGAALKRIVIPCGVLTEVGDIVYKDNDSVSYPLTITGLPDDDASSNGAPHYEYIKEA